MNAQTLNKTLGNIDIYLLDQILKGRYHKEDHILDAGCGEGRNMIYFLNNRYNIYGIDKHESALQMLRFLTHSIDPSFDATRITTGYLDQLPYKENFFNHIICSAVLHFAENEDHFQAMLLELLRVLKPGGSIFIRMTSNIGIEAKVIALDNQQYQVPDGSIRFLLTRKLLKKIFEMCHVTLLEPVKTVNVEDRRCMSNLLLKKLNS